MPKKDISHCIYCTNPPDGEEHWLPASLGAFKGNTKLRGRICTPCNVRLGQTIDDELAHAGPTGFARQLLAIRGRSGQDKKNVFDFKASQIEPPIQIYKGADDSHQTLLQAISRNVDGTFKAVERRYLTVEMTDGSREVLPFPIGWGPDQLRRAAETRGLLGGRVVRAHAAPPESALDFRDAAKDTIREVFGPSLVDIFESNMNSEPQPIEPTLVRFNLSPEYLRAVAKVAFHYFLWACPQIGGDESDFSAIRNFVSAGTGDVNRFLQRHDNRIDRVSEADGGSIEPCHMFVAYAAQTDLLVTLHFFSQAEGPQFPTFSVRLSVRPATLPPGWCRGHIAIYSAVAGHAGELRELETPE